MLFAPFYPKQSSLVVTITEVSLKITINEKLINKKIFENYFKFQNFEILDACEWFVCFSIHNLSYSRRIICEIQTSDFHVKVNNLLSEFAQVCYIWNNFCKIKYVNPKDNIYLKIKTKPYWKIYSLIRYMRLFVQSKYSDYCKAEIHNTCLYKV